MGPRGVFGMAFMIGGGIFAVLLLWQFVSISHTVATGIERPGQVTGIELNSPVRGKRPSHRPVVRFVDLDGDEHFVAGRLSIGRGLNRVRSTHEIGEEVTVRYPPGRPGDAVITGFAQHWSFLLMSLFPMLLVWIGLRQFRKDRREQEELGW